MEKQEITSPALLMEMANAFRLSRIILTANELGIFDMLAHDANSSDWVAAQLQTHPRATDRLLNALVAVGLLHKHEDLFNNTDFSAKFLVKASQAYLGGLSLSNQTWKT